MYLIREETDTSLPQIGELLGGRDHTTIMHGCDKIAAQIETDEQTSPRLAGDQGARCRSASAQR